MPRAKVLTPLPAHPAIVSDIFDGRCNGRACSAVTVRCPRCGVERDNPATTIRRELLRENFKGYCRPCSFAAIREGVHLQRFKHKKRGHHGNGYKLLGVADISIEDMPMFRQMQNKSNTVLEHRWVMAKHLGRALRSDELVDHMDGDKLNNSPENLRIYLRGKNHPGSGNGYGTYYDEFVRAQSRIAQLEILLRENGVAIP